MTRDDLEGKTIETPSATVMFYSLSGEWRQLLEEEKQIMVTITTKDSEQGTVGRVSLGQAMLLYGMFGE